MKDYRDPRAKPGQPKAQRGELPNEAADLVLINGEGPVPRQGHNLLYSMVCSKRHSPINGWDPSFFEELKVSGYDIERETGS